MTERNLYVQSIPLVAEIIVERWKLSKSEFRQWKNEVMRETMDSAKPFMEKVIMVIEDNL